MKRSIILFAVCLLSVLSLCACSGKNKKVDMPDMNMVIGRIEKIEGNTVELSLADTESMFGGNRGNFNFENFGNGEMPEGFEAPENFDGEMPEDFSGGMPFGFNGEMPEGFDGEMPEGFSGEMPEGFNGEMPEGGFSQFGSMMNIDASSLTFSGEKKSYSIPEGLTIGQGDYTSLEVGDVIMLSFGEDDEITGVTVIGDGEAATQE